MRKAALILMACAVVFATTYFSCGSNYPPPTPGGGFYVQTYYLEGVAPFILVSGHWQKDYPGAAGSVFSFNGETDQVGHYDVPNGRDSAQWLFAENNGFCGGESVSGPVGPYSPTVELFCEPGTGVLSSQYVASPNPLYSSSPPGEVTITGPGFTTEYGMPRVQYFYNDGTYVGEVVATSVTSTSISGPPLSNLGSLPTGVYVGEIEVATLGGGWRTIGAADLDLVTPTAPVIGHGGGGGPPCKPCPLTLPVRPPLPEIHP